jgi:CNT family concentrative nucleoside transporter
MLIGFIALIAMVDYLLGWMGRGLYGSGVSLSAVGIDVSKLSLKEILGSVFSLFAWTMGVPWKDAHEVGGLLGTKIVINEFVAYSKLSPMIAAQNLAPKSIMIASFALCGFANFSSIAIQVGGIGELAPSRRADLAKLGFKALICGTLASYLGATLAGIMM